MINKKAAAPRRVLAVLFAVVLIHQSSALMLMPLLPQLLHELTGEALSANALWSGWLIGVYSLMQLLSAPLIGRASDAFGRKPVLLGCLTVLSVNYGLMAMAENVWLLLAARLLAGMAGGSVAAAMAAAADISTPHNRARHFSLLYGAMGLGVVCGPAISGMLSVWNLRLPLYTAAVLCVLCVAWLWVALPETAAPRPNAAPSGRAKSLFPKLSAWHKPHFRYLLVGQFLAVFGLQAPIALWSFLLSHRFGWQAQQIASALAVLGIGYAVVQLGVVRFSLPYLGTVKSIFVGLSCYVAGLTCYAFAATPPLLYVGMAVYLFGAMGSGAATGLFASEVKAEEQGQLQGMLASLWSLAALAASLALTRLFAFDVNAAHGLNGGLPFLLSAILVASGIMCFRIGLKKQPQN